MNEKSGSMFSRRQFARRAAVLSTAASLVPAGGILAGDSSASASQSSHPLSSAGQREADSRYQQILSLYGEQLDDAQKAKIKKMCEDLQPTLEKIRNFNLVNGNAPALFLKPLFERDKKPKSPAAPKKP